MSLSIEISIYLYFYLFFRVIGCSMKLLRSFNPQPSVRFLHEWAVVRAVVALPELEQLLWNSMDRAVAQRTGSMVSFLTIVGHISRCLGSISDRLHSFVLQVT